MRAVPLPDVTDEQALKRVLSGDANAFEILLSRYKALVFGIVSRHVPADAVPDTAQDTFIRAYRSLGRVQHPDRMKGWFSTIATRACHDYWRARYRRRETAFSGLSEASEQWLEEAVAQKSIEEMEEAGSRDEARRVLEEALDRLSPSDRLVLELVHLEGRSAREAARLMGISEANVRIRAFRSRNKLRNLLGRGAEEP